MIITLDGPAAAGKGTLAKKLSQKYGLAYFDTGMIYRAVGLEMVLKGYDLNDTQSAEKIAQNLTFPQMMALSTHADFRSPLGGEAASCVAAMPEVRKALLKMQQDFALQPVFSDGTKAQGVIYDGRDTGTVVCPTADVKIFMTATPEIRAMRRLKEFQANGIETSFEKVFEDIRTRDERDAQRTTAPLKPADGALIFDTSDFSIEEVFAKVCEIIDNRPKNS